MFPEFYCIIQIIKLLYEVVFIKYQWLTSHIKIMYKNYFTDPAVKFLRLRLGIVAQTSPEMVDNRHFL